MGLWYTKDSGFKLTVFSDVDYAGCKDTFKSTSDGTQFLGEKLVSWSSKKQECTAFSIAEAEYVSLSAYCAQVLWMRTQLTDYGFHFNKIPIYCDSKSTIAISCNLVQHSRTKCVIVCYYFIKEQVEKGQNRRDLPRDTLLDRIEVLRQVIMDPVKQRITLPATQTSPKRSLFHFSRSTKCFYRLSHSEIVDIEKVAVRSSL
uniref:Copia protein n=1 Tax=Tanacetum cinerariifolium TaxID=118510 RepID=A0A6L2MMU2_TANCI|nr:copia protein [Tanacetum cinerariifolium]